MLSFSIFDIPQLEKTFAYEQAQKTLSLHPRLREIYDVDFLQMLAGRRRGRNYLLFMLVQPDSTHTNTFWTSVCNDLEVLASAASYETFKSKLRSRDYETLEAARSELALAARLRRLGYDVRLEEPTRNGRDCDLVASTEPATYWEIKAVQDLESVVEESEVAFDIQARLRRIAQPYALAIRPSRVSRTDVSDAVREIKRQLAAHYNAAGVLPQAFSSHGLIVEAWHTKRAHGYLGSTLYGGKIFGAEHATKIRSRIISAIEQLREDRAGVVVIDTTTASWVEKHDVVDACFGSEGMSFDYNSGQEWRTRDSEAGAFQATQRRRVSAVVHYTRHPRDAGQSLLIIHNPFARMPIPLETLAADDVQQLHREDMERGYRLVMTPPSDEKPWF